MKDWFNQHEKHSLLPNFPTLCNTEKTTTKQQHRYDEQPVNLYNTGSTLLIVDAETDQSQSLIIIKICQLC